MSHSGLFTDQAIELQHFIQQALYEDVREGDHSALACIPRDARGKAKLLVKEAGKIAGVQVAKAIFKFIDPTIQFEQLIEDGTEVGIGDIVFTVEGPSISLLTGERLVLNCMQRMSAIATKTSYYVSLLDGLDTKVLDTRKTTPGFRLLEKWAVTIGGGYNHRFGLYDMIMLKDNHIDFVGGIRKAIEKTHTYLKETALSLPIEVETRDLKEVAEVLEVGGIQRIMLDNFNYKDTNKAVDLIDGQYETESSGGINESTIRAYAECGVDYISVGALTHGVKSIDLSLKAF
ncbi:MAG: nicotinate-nucleotide pyrophosphorylase (carboxylating) [Flavobacteriales bacterium]|jgi:nicotinate-nucleotide pyrophosphorylase (carboxylating)